MIGLLTDSTIANIPLMKIASFYKDIEWYFPFKHDGYEKIYYSKIFKFSTNLDFKNDMIIGGTGYNVSIKLPEDIEKQKLNYNIYPDCDYSLQYFSRGCIRSCDFCLVNSKEGMIHPVEPMNLNPKGKYIRVMDNNFFANPLWRDSVSYLKKLDQPIHFDGIDIRIFNEDHGNALKSLKIHKNLHIAWDNPRQDLSNKIKLMFPFVKPYKIMVYVLIGYNSTPEEDLYRVEKLRNLKVSPYVMPFNKRNKYQKNFARWCNHKAIFKTVTWKDYK